MANRVSSTILGIWIMEPRFWGKGGRRGRAMAPFERAMVVSYRLSIVAAALCNDSATIICERMSRTLKSTGDESLWAKISGCSPCSRPLMFGSADSEHPRLTNCKIISEEFQSTMYVITIHQRHRRTDGRTNRRHAIARPRFALGLKCIAL